MYWLRRSQNTCSCSVDLEPDPLCTASLLSSTLKEGRKGTHALGKSSLCFSNGSYQGKKKEGREAFVVPKQPHSVCIIDRHTPRITSVHISAYKHACSSHSGETGWKLSSLCRKYYCCSAVKVTVSLGYLLCKYQPHKSGLAKGYNSYTQHFVDYVL